MDKIQIVLTPVKHPFKSEIIWSEYHQSCKICFYLKIETEFFEESTMYIFKLKQQILTCFFPSVFDYSLVVAQFWDHAIWQLWKTSKCGIYDLQVKDCLL